MKLAALLIAAAASVSPPPLVPKPKVEANQILTYALGALRALPSGRTDWRVLADQNLTLSIGREPGLAQGALSVYEPAKRTILINADFLDDVYNEMEAEGLTRPDEVARHMGLKLAPALAHEACHAALSQLLKAAAGAAPPDDQRQEAVCLYEELLAWKELDETSPWAARKTVSELDRVRDRIEAALRPPLLCHVAEHYPGLAGPAEETTPMAYRWLQADRAVTLLQKKIRGGGAGLESWQEALSGAERLASLDQPLLSIHPPPMADAARLSREQTARADRFLDEKVRWIEERLSKPDWDRWRLARYPWRALDRAKTDKERLAAASAAAISEARWQPDLQQEGNPFFLRRARAAARALGEDFSLVENEVARLQEAKIESLLANSERLAAQGDDDGRRWSYRCLKRAEVESREVWDMTPQWIQARESAVIETLRKQLATK